MTVTQGMKNERVSDHYKRLLFYAEDQGIPASLATVCPACGKKLALRKDYYIIGLAGAYHRRCFLKTSKARDRQLRAQRNTANGEGLRK